MTSRDCACGDMSWLLADPPGADELVAYEAMLNEFFVGAPACGMCQYPRGRLPAHILDWDRDAFVRHYRSPAPSEPVL